MNKINWKASAKECGLMVNLLDSTSSAQVLIYLDVEDETIWKYEEIHEAGISLAVSLAEQFLQRGIATGLITNGRDHITEAPIAVLPGTGRGQLVKLYQNLARLDLDLSAGKFPELLSAQRRLLSEGRGQRPVDLHAVQGYGVEASELAPHGDHTLGGAEMKIDLLVVYRFFHTQGLTKNWASAGTSAPATSGRSWRGGGADPGGAGDGGTDAVSSGRI